MRVLENECVSCGLPCLGNSCPNRNVPHYYCDECKEESVLYDSEFGELCADCLLEKFPIVEGSEW